MRNSRGEFQLTLNRELKRGKTRVCGGEGATLGAGAEAAGTALGARAGAVAAGAAAGASPAFSRRKASRRGSVAKCTQKPASFPLLPMAMVSVMVPLIRTGFASSGSFSSRVTSAACLGATRQRTKIVSKLRLLVVVCMVIPPPEKRTGTTMGIGSIKGSEQYRNFVHQVHALGMGRAAQRNQPHASAARGAKRGGEGRIDLRVGRHGAHVAALGAE